jgi:FtsZ-interacting cell division protein ZipA
VAEPDPDATPDPVEQQAVAPDAAGETVEKPQEAQAPPEATTEIVTEATAAPAASPRPPGQRPAAPQPQVIETPTSTPAEPSTSSETDAVTAALEEALSGAETPAPATPAAPSGPPLSAGEKESLRVAVSACWNVGSLSSAALQTTVVVSVNMNQNGTPVIETIRQVGASGGSDADAKRVFDSARRAIILCGSKGYNLPSDKFSQWQTIEMTFDPKKMGSR